MFGFKRSTLDNSIRNIILVISGLRVKDGKVICNDNILSYDINDFLGNFEVSFRVPPKFSFGLFSEFSKGERIPHRIVTNSLGRYNNNLNVFPIDDDGKMYIELDLAKPSEIKNTLDGFIGINDLPHGNCLHTFKIKCCCGWKKIEEFSTIVEYYISSDYILSTYVNNDLKDDYVIVDDLINLLIDITKSYSILISNSRVLNEFANTLLQQNIENRIEYIGNIEDEVNFMVNKLFKKNINNKMTDINGYYIIDYNDSNKSIILKKCDDSKKYIINMSNICLAINKYFINGKLKIYK